MTEMNRRLDQLETHLEAENPVLLDVVKSYRDLDRLARKLALFDQEQSFATEVPWFPLISVLGTFSAGKSTFINDFLGVQVQKSGNQAVDDKFSVICYGPSEKPRTLPGIALDADMRFPLYGISEQIERVSEGEGRRIDAYLQLKTVKSPALSGKILIDSPGFDADAQRTSTLQITDQIITLSDLVLVFFDARHPEPGAMADTLEHLVSKTLRRPDASKFLFILNQIDTAAGEDNPEEIVAAWQRALASSGLTAGRFYTIYSYSAGGRIDDPALAERFERKRDADYAEIMQRMNDVQTERVYRIVSALENQAHRIRDTHIPLLMELKRGWRNWTLGIDLFFLLLLIAAVVVLGVNGIEFVAIDVLIVGLFVTMLLLHFWSRSIAAKIIKKRIGNQPSGIVDYKYAFTCNTRIWRSIFFTTPAGWRKPSLKRLKKIIAGAGDFVRALNDSFTDPSGGKH